MGFLKYILAFVAALSLLYFGFWYGLSEVTVGPPQAPPALEPAAWKEERLKDLGLSIRHPAEYPTIEGADTTFAAGSFLAVRSVPRFTVAIPKTPFKGTNFLHGFVTVSAEAGGGGRAKGDAAKCDLLAPAGSETRMLPKREEIGGISFAVGGVSGSAGSMIAETLVYHALIAGRCVELTANLFSTNIRSVDRRKVKDFDRVAAWSMLTDIVRTLHPLEKGGR